MFMQDSDFLIDRLRKINIDNKLQLRRLRSEVEHICKEQNIELTTKCKRISCVPYIKELISKIKNLEKNNVHRKFSINPKYTEMANDKNNKYSMFIKQTAIFESTMTQLSYKKCDICHQRRLKIIVTDGVCSRCKSQKGNYTFCHGNKTLPTWIQNNIIKYSVPPELQNLTIAEKLLIQRVSPLIPVIHIKNGSVGSRGHVVSFYQDISGICNELPKLPSDVSVVKVLRSGITGKGENVSRTLTVNRCRVINALRWLKNHNPLYRDIKIIESNLGWMKGKRSENLSNVITIECNESNDEDGDKGPCENQVIEPYNLTTDPEEECYGCVSSEKTQITFDGDSELAEAIRKNSKNRKIPIINWPTREVKPISEYSDTKIFCLAFPWLFPGGIGDIKESRIRDVDIGEWAQNLLFYEDGRFAKDNLWSFFTLNYLQRHRNKSQSRWFVKDFVGNSPPSLDALQEQIQQGDQTFIDKLMYFGKLVPGSTAYWRSKKAELYSWINHHIEKGRGAPNIFMTLSCAEYFWPDLKRVLEEYILLTENRKVDLNLNHSELNKVLNDYTVVVQEFFQIRVEEYLKTIGIHVFGIKKYWGRFEFAKSRGQIHLHLLGITDDAVGPNGIYTKLFKWKNNKKRQTQIMANWIRSKFNCTAELQHHSPEPDQQSSPCKLRFCETECIEKDQESLCKFCQIHKCNDYCMRKPNDDKESKELSQTKPKINKVSPITM
jgi:Helitron helicase-like domain at N-terminus